MPAHIVVAVLGRIHSRLVVACCLASGLAGLVGCQSTAGSTHAIQGHQPVAAAVARGKAEEVTQVSAQSPAPWTGEKQSERPVQWAESRQPSPPPAGNGTQTVDWRPLAKQPPPQVLVHQGPVLGTTQSPVAAEGGLQVEQGPVPRPIQGEQNGNVVPPPGGIVVGPAPAVVLGPPVAKVPTELRKVSLPPYTVAPPDILLVESTRSLPNQPIRGQHLVRPDGTISLGIYGTIYVAGMTLDQIRPLVARTIESRLDKDVVDKNPVKVEDINVDVLAYNSKVYYIITDGGGYGEQVYRIPATGNECVLDAISQINGLPAVASKKHIWVARRTATGGKNNVLPVDWCGIVQRGETMTNYQLFPGDRVYIQADRLITADSWLAKVLAPVERVLGVTLLGSSTVNSIRNGNNFNNTNR